MSLRFHVYELPNCARLVATLGFEDALGYPADVFTRFVAIGDEVGQLLWQDQLRRYKAMPALS
ncbi:hypothetical protein [Rhizobium sp. BE258]|uniref:hypothetical protein n=1 Tax=Rhizobium sp. BE258 TaxID=2817722 RepID=UPI002861E209|nr:hypothetical protein [Rhizobium sp. BE258]MDR7148027.1 hypothetical protein [Rhizobium sp. BE258]